MNPASKISPQCVSVLIPLALPKPYDYEVPEGLIVDVGDYVVVPLGTQELVGVVWGRGTIGDFTHASQGDH